jgi:hypothetical protein
MNQRASWIHHVFILLAGKYSPAGLSWRKKYGHTHFLFSNYIHIPDNLTGVVERNAHTRLFSERSILKNVIDS